MTDRVHGELRQRQPIVKRRRKQTRAQRELDHQAREEFKRTVLRLDGGDCAARRAWPDHVCYGPIQCHHAIKQQWLRSHISTLGLSEEEILEWLWDPGNGLCLCQRAHERQSLRVEPVPLEALPARVADWARDRGLFHLLEREHPPLTKVSG